MNSIKYIYILLWVGRLASGVKGVEVFWVDACTVLCTFFFIPFVLDKVAFTLGGYR
jgi:hypothetical protein